MRGNGWYFDSVAKEAVELDLIQQSDIRYQVKAPLKLDRRHFYSLVQDLCKLFCSPKQAVVAFIRFLAKKYKNCDTSYFSIDLEEVAGDFSMVMAM